MIGTGPASGALERSWEAALAGGAPARRSILVAGLHLRVEAAGTDVLDTFWPALAHHPEAPPTGEPLLVLRLWDLASTGAPRPPLAPGMILHDEGLLQPSAEIDGVYLRYDAENLSLCAHDPGRRLAWCCFESTDAVTPMERAAPLRWLIAWWLEAAGLTMVHGAALEDEGKAVIFAGPAGSGKSTTALAGARAGLGFLGDDYCVVEHTPTPTVWSLYSTTKLRRPEGAEGADGRRHKDVVFVGETAGANLVESARVAAVVAVRIGATGETRLLPASAADVLRAIAPSSILQLRGTGAPTLAGLARLVREVPVGVLELGRDEDEILSAIRLLARGGRP